MSKLPKAMKGEKIADLIFYEWQIKNKFLSDALKDNLEGKFVVDGEFVAQLEAKFERWDAIALAIDGGEYSDTCEGLVGKIRKEVLAVFRLEAEEKDE